jgi:hypothetical protein
MPRSGPAKSPARNVSDGASTADSEAPANEPQWLNWLQLAGATRSEQAKTALAAIGALFLLWKVSRIFRRTGRRRPQRRRARAA